MKPIKDVYPECDQESHLEGERWFRSPSDYMPLLCSLGDLVYKGDFGSYSGDSVVLYQKYLPTGPGWGFLVFGWGSCSGCDALQGCDSYQELETLREKLAGEIKWGTAEEIIAHIDTREAANPYYISEETWPKIVAAIKAIIAAHAKSDT